MLGDTTNLLQTDFNDGSVWGAGLRVGYTFCAAADFRPAPPPAAARRPGISATLMQQNQQVVRRQWRRVRPAPLARLRHRLARSARTGARMFYETPDDWTRARHKRVALFGMSGVGKTRIAAMLREEAELVPLLGRFPHRHPLHGRAHRRQLQARGDAQRRSCAQLLRSDSIYIASNITFQNLEPLSTYLGKPGDPAKGGIPFDEYLRRQRQHREAEIAGTRDVLTVHRQGRARSTATTTSSATPRARSARSSIRSTRPTRC